MGARPPFGLKVSITAIAIFAGLFLALPARAGDVESAKGKLEEAKRDLEGQSWGRVEEDLKAAEDFLDGVPEADKAPVAKELAAIRKQAAPQVRAWKAKAIVDSATRYISSAADEMQAIPERAVTDLKEATDRLNTDEAKANVDPDARKKLEGRIAGLQQMAIDRVKKRKMEFIAPIMKELEEKVASDPFKGADQQAAYRTGQELSSLESRIRGAFSDLPADDADVKAVNAKLAAIDKKIEAGANAGEQSEVADHLVKSWQNTQEYFTGWDQEKQGPTWARYSKESSQAMGSLLMPKTVEAITRTKYWLDDSQAKEAVAKYPTNATIKSTIDTATKTLDTAAGKLSAAFNSILDEAEKLPTPGTDSERSRPDSMASDADRWFAGTKYHDPNVARAKKLFEKWKGEIEGNAKAADELYAKLTEQAAAAWPKIDAGITAQDGFNPADADKLKGKVVRLKGVYNRSGWDYAPDYNFAIAINGMPVVGNYDANVKAAYQDIGHRTHRDPDDHTPWDVIGVVEGPGKIHEA